MATLNTKIILAKNVRQDKEYKHVYITTEASYVQQLLGSTYFVAQTETASFINDTGQIYVPFSYSQCLSANYIAFQNPNYDNKWFFGFIDKIVFHSENMQEIKYTTDVFSTWFNKLNINIPCLVEREHVSDDTIGLHTIEEDLNVGEVICIEETEDSYLKGSHWIGVFSSWNPENNISETDRQFARSKCL